VATWNFDSGAAGDPRRLVYDAVLTGKCCQQVFPVDTGSYNTPEGLNRMSFLSYKFHLHLCRDRIAFCSDSDKKQTHSVANMQQLRLLKRTVHIRQ
jgi:hypothetical protein